MWGSSSVKGEGKFRACPLPRMVKNVSCRKKNFKREEVMKEVINLSPGLKRPDTPAAGEITSKAHC